jgi:hypothetical protein
MKIKKVKAWYTDKSWFGHEKDFTSGIWTEIITLSMMFATKIRHTTHTKQHGVTSFPCYFEYINDNLAI